MDDATLREILATRLPAREVGRYATLARCAWSPLLDPTEAAWARAMMQRMDARWRVWAEAA